MKHTLSYMVAAVTMLLCGCQRDIIVPGASQDGVVKFAPGSVSPDYGIRSQLPVEACQTLPLVSDDGSIVIPMSLTVMDADYAALTKGTPVTAYSASALSDTFMVAAWNNTVPVTKCIPYGIDENISGFTSRGYQKVIYRRKDVSGANLVQPYWTTVQPYTFNGTPIAADDEYIWRLDGNELESKTFFAFANASAASMTLLDNGAGQRLAYGLPSNAKNHHDILLGYYKGRGDKGTAKIDFIHPLTAVRFRRDAGMGDNVTVKSITLRGLATNGSAEMNGNGVCSWTVGGTYGGSATLDNGGMALEVDGNMFIGKDSGAFLLIPQSLATNNVSVTAVLTFKNMGDATVEAVIASGVWEMGKVNIYTIGYGVAPLAVN